MTTQLTTSIPIFSAVLTPQEFLSDGRRESFAEHFVLKGAEAARACATTFAGCAIARVA
jgi:6,7-dimethyl-8-ribityllumazine synthase